MPNSSYSHVPLVTPLRLQREYLELSTPLPVMTPEKLAELARQIEPTGEWEALKIALASGSASFEQREYPTLIVHGRSSANTPPISSQDPRLQAHHIYQSVIWLALGRISRTQRTAGGSRPLNIPDSSRIKA
jgi:hypothetical protein